MSAIGLLVGLCSLAGCSGGDDAAIAQEVATDVSGVTQNWDKVLSAAQRFVVLSSFSREAVRDNNTGLVWQTRPEGGTNFWGGAKGQCINSITGGTKGWRLPTIAELASLVDPSVQGPGPFLTPGHPFVGVSSAIHWSASTLAESPTGAWIVDFSSGLVSSDLKANFNRIWCVRGAMQESVY